MKNKIPSYLKNKFILTTIVFAVYMLFLDDIDIFTIINQNHKLSLINESKSEMKSKLKEVRITLKKLRYATELEAYAREEKLFKKDDEDIFVISYE